MNAFNRREFLERSAILSAAVAAGASLPAGAAEAPVKTAARAANDRLRVAVVGVRGRGMSHVAGFLSKNANCTIDVVCDCDEAVIGKAVDSIKKAQGEAPRYEKDIRKVIDDKNIDVVSIATPNHWHALMAVWAMRAGKDVYVEKPATHNVHEGRLMIEAARKYNRICQVGTQSRSTTGMRAAIEFIHAGKIGKVDLAYATCYKPRNSIGKVDKPTAPPASMDYDLWCGPAPKLPVMRKGLHYDWHWIWAYGNGDLGNQGVHEMDKARWGLGQTTMPASVVSLGGRFGYVDDGETANTQLALFDYGSSHMIFEVRGLKTDDYKGVKVGNIWFGENGYVVCPSYSSGLAYDKDGKQIAKFGGGGDQSHFDNFVKGVRSRKLTDLNCEVAEGHLSAALCHLANISYRLGKETPFDANLTELAGTKDAAVVEAVSRMKLHLTDNKVDLAKAIGRVGPKLTIDPKTEKFTGSDVAKANDMLFREYRKGFDITEAV
ncbi:Gfo/Idh/MocA family protein [Fimbriiglobus ruber]|uniref:Myo-inositol 2-dehydrogenase n=1 Tax=Fimbriiglobus ruber TaxID=1908690 RepID=A0A225DVD8_9BACT|nr:Gfo/Idh/MocA family oxidoreductase [Fimbriiglobus ruber]OWK41586.1 Myo-inositol 2-dehydrogenase [Fimbriiglobus ruber]